MEGAQKKDIDGASRIYQNSLDIPFAMLHRDDQGIIIMRVYSEASSLDKVMLTLVFPSVSIGKLGDITFYGKHMACVFPSRGSEATSTEKYPDNGVCVVR